MNEENRNVPGLMAEQRRVSEDALSSFGSLSTEQLNWKPGDTEWSVGQCLEHLISTNRPYFAKIEKIVSGQNKATFAERLPVLPGLFGRFIINAVNPDNVKKLKARGGFIPTSSSVDADVVARFIKSQEQLLSLMQQTVALPVHKIFVTSPIAAVITYSLLDAYTIMANHNRRHLNQAKRVMEMVGFPKAEAGVQSGAAGVGV